MDLDGGLLQVKIHVESQVGRVVTVPLVLLGLLMRRSITLTHHSLSNSNMKSVLYYLPELSRKKRRQLNCNYIFNSQAKIDFIMFLSGDEI